MTYLHFLHLLAAARPEALRIFEAYGPKERRGILQDAIILQNSPSDFMVLMAKNLLAVDINTFNC